MNEELNNEFDDINEKEFEELIKFIDSMEMEQDIDYNKIGSFLGLDFNEIQNEIDKSATRMKLIFTKSNIDAKTPSYAYESDSGFDLYSVEDKWIHPFDRALIPTGLQIDIPEGYEIQIRSKSGLALKSGLMVLNSPGTVDQGYTGEIQVILFNTTNQKVKIEKNQKIAQAVLCPVVSGKWINFLEKPSINTKDRNENGFGSTGI